MLQTFDFFVVPMLNPDGVEKGYFRVNAAGLDPNRCYQTAERALQAPHDNPHEPESHTRSPKPRIYDALPELTALLRSLAPRLAVYADFHSYETRRCEGDAGAPPSTGCFLYGTDDALPKAAGHPMKPPRERESAQFGRGFAAALGVRRAYTVECWSHTESVFHWKEDAEKLMEGLEKMSASADGGVGR